MRKVYDKRSPGQADLIEHLIRVRAVALEDDMGGVGIVRYLADALFVVLFLNFGEAFQ